ncbi:MAG TPA: ABC transporter permease [Solirubrobacteraceae bacterium]|jgi:lipooligosaccharide transport system permease protein|nr:ABC transporter permease [Solirubrobacteraceae bacterium]
MSVDETSVAFGRNIGGATTRRIRRLEPAALAGVMSRDVAIFGRYWKATTFSSIMQPTIYLLAFGIGFGSLLKPFGQLTYEQYVATGVVATAVLFSSAFPGMFNTFVRWQFQRTYDAILAAPVDTEELVTAEILWISVRAGVYGMAPLLVGFAFGLEPNVGMLLVPLIGFVTGFGFAGFGVTMAAIAKTIDNFNYITSAVLTPMFLVAGTFFPVSQLPTALRTIAEFNPLYHCVQLVRDASLGHLGVADLGHAAVLIAFALLMWRLAIWRLGSRLID